MPKFFVAQNQIEDESIYINGEDVNHIVNVLRLTKDDEILICNKDRNITYKAKIDRLAKDKVVCKIEEMIEDSTESNIFVTIFQGLPKADKMEYIIQKTTELGVKEIVPVMMKRSIVKLEGKEADKKIERWQKIAEVAAKQSGRDAIPTIGKILKVQELSKKISDYDIFIIAYEKENDVTLKQVLKNTKINENENLKIGVLIGPEGGIDETEIDLFKEKGVKTITLGKRILRTETAPIAILSNIMYEYEL